MALNARQTELLDRLLAAAAAQGKRSFVYRTEWLGFLPYGAYQWIDIVGRDGTRECGAYLSRPGQVTECGQPPADRPASA